MVKSLTAIFASVLLLVGVSLFEWFYVEDQFRRFGEELDTLYLKADDGSANVEDAKAVQASWEQRKEGLHVWIPHNDVRLIDEYMAEAVRLIGVKDYPLALSKLEVLIHLTKCLPDTYKPGLENVF